MKKNKMNKKAKHSLIFIVVTCLVLLLIVFLLVQEHTETGSYTSLPQSQSEEIAELNSLIKANSNRDYCYLSDISYIQDQSYAASGHSIKLDRNDSDGLLSLKVNGNSKSFIKGICAWASSQIVYDLSNYDYDYFTSYLGVDISEQNNYFNTGLRFFIYTSNDGQTWDKKAETPALYGWSEAVPVKVDIKDAKYLKLVADKNSNNWWAEWYDEAVYANAKLIKEGYVESDETLDAIKTVTEYDDIIKAHINAGEDATVTCELTLLQREFVKNVGYDLLQSFVQTNEDYKNAVLWLMNDVDNLRLYILGGKPSGTYISSLKVLSDLYAEYSDDFSIENETSYGTKYGDLYKKMAITLSLTHSQKVALWMQPNATENQSDAVKRYAIFKYLHKNGKFKASESLDITPWFEALQVEEMRFVLNNAIDDEEILWLNEYVQSQIDANPTRVGSYLTPHPYMAYVWPNYGNDIYYAEDNKTYFNDLFSVPKGEEKVGLFDLSYTIPGGKNNPEYTFSVTRGTSNYKLYKVWMNFRNKFGTGAVCGGISKTGSNIRTTHGIPATVIGQPGHAALLYYTKNSQGKGYWGIDNDVSGWTLSEKGERMLLGWGNASYSRGYSVVYMVLAQEAINDYENLVKCEEEVMLANVYEGDLVKQEEIYRKALKIQHINIDAWYGLIDVYNKSTTKTQSDYLNLAEELAENLKCFPLPMYHLTNLIEPKLTNPEATTEEEIQKNMQYSYEFTLLQTRILTEGSTLPNSSTAVLQPSVTRVEANYLLGKMDKTIATFSFDGDDAGKIVLSSRFDGNGIRWDYCLLGKEKALEGKQNWTEVAFTGDEEHKLQLTPEEIESITAENDIYIHIVGVGYEEKNLYKIDITEQTMPNLFANDLENSVMGATLTMEWRMEGSNDWTSYKEASPNLSGDKTVYVRLARTGTKLASDEVAYTFTKDNQPLTRKYIPVSHLSIEAVSTEATGNQGYAKNAIDGNYNTRYHSAWNGTDTERYITIKLDEPVNLSAVEFVPAGGGNGKIYDGTIWGSVDGENWTELTNLKNLTYTNQANTNEDAIANTKSFEIENPQEVQYVKIVADRTNGNWFTARAFNLFEDMSDDPHPISSLGYIGYNVQEPTNKEVIARLSSPSNITITNNGGSDSYTFTKNGSFTFEFRDDEGLTGIATATVDWIDVEAPTATIEYSPSTRTNGEVIAKLIPSEDVTVLNNGEYSEGSEDGSTATNNPFEYTFEENGEFTFEFEDAVGNRGTATAKVDWIGTILGDIDGDGEVTIDDLTKAKLHVIGLITLEGDSFIAGDVNQDGEISIDDITIIKLMIIGLR